MARPCRSLHTSRVRARVPAQAGVGQHDLAFTALSCVDAETGRQALEQGRAELPGQIASSQRELDARPPQNKARRERLGWQVENLARGLAYVRERLGALRTEG